MVQMVIIEWKKDKEPANLIEEGTIFGDILLGDFDDSFQNLSMKEHLFLDFDKVSKTFIFYCTTLRYAEFREISKF